jgi:hypothetical protein
LRRCRGNVGKIVGWREGWVRDGGKARFKDGREDRGNEVVGMEDKGWK